MARTQAPWNQQWRWTRKPFCTKQKHFTPVRCPLPHPSIAHTITDTASSEDATELSFKKGEVLDILTKSDLWWEARKSDGTEGSQSFQLQTSHFNTHPLALQLHLRITLS